MKPLNPLNKTLLGLFVAVLLIVTMGCGKKENPVPPPIVNTQPQRPGGGGGYGCGSVAGVRSLLPDGGNITGNLYTQQGGAFRPNTFDLNISYADQYYSPNVVASGNFSLDIAGMLGMGGSGNTTLNQPFCASSADPQSGQPIYGYAQEYGQTVEIRDMVLIGYAQVPAVSPFNPYPGYPGQGGSQYLQETVIITMGRGCQTWLDRYTRRLGGCVIVQIGNNGQQIYFQSQ